MVVHVIIVSATVQIIRIFDFLDLVRTYGQDLGPFGTGIRIGDLGEAAPRAGISSLHNT